MRIPGLAVVALLLFSVLPDIYIFFDIRKYCRSDKRKKVISWTYLGVSVLMWAFLVIVLCIPKRDEDRSILPVMWMLYSYLTVYVPKIIYSICSLIGRIFSRGSRKLNAGAKTGICLGVLVFILLWWGILFTRHDIVVNEVDITSAKLPESFDGFKVLQFSDAHVGTWGSDTTFVSKLVDRINSSGADMIVFTGDIVNRRSSEIDPFIPVLRRLKAPNGVYAILGNHDYAGYVDWNDPADANKDVGRLCYEMEGMGWKLLKNQTAFITSARNDSIVLIGVENWGEPPFNQLGDLGKSYPEGSDRLHGLNDNMFKILLTHNPQHWSQVATKISNIDLSLAGHTHAMQMMVKLGDWKWSPAAFRYKEWGGLYNHTAKDGTPMSLYVNIGAGEVGFPARLGAAKPELTLFTLHPSK